MNKNRSIKTILELILNDIDKLETGLCLIALQLLRNNKIAENEYILFKDYIYNNRPKNKDSIYYWKPYEKFYRIKWLEKHIKANGKQK